MTERGRTRLARDENTLAIGPSAIRRDGDALVLTIDEICAPVPRRVRGTIRIEFDRLEQIEYALDSGGAHRWRPLAPHARIAARFDRPDLSWRGSCYVDCNAGDEPLEARFRSWNWSRAHLGDHAVVLYDALRRDGSRRSLSLLFDRDGVRSFDPPPVVALPKTRWGLERATRADAGATASILQEFEDTPFYSRSLLRTRLMGESVQAVHESLSLDRFCAPTTQLMLPFRMPRRR